jgi:outer membrane protein TolC
VSITLPLFSGNQGRIAEAEASRGQAGSRAEAMRQSIASEISIAWNEASGTQQQLGQYRESLFPVSARSVKLAQKGYAEGLVTMAEVLQAQRQQADLDAAYLDTLDQFLQALVRLRTAAGDYLRAPAGVDTEQKDS